jgi:hypothetical protein
MIDDGGPGNPLSAFNAERRELAAAHFQRANVSLPQLWVYYFGIGGNADELALDGYLHGMVELAPLQVDLLDTAIKEITADEP